MGTLSGFRRGHSAPASTPCQTRASPFGDFGTFTFPCQTRSLRSRPRARPRQTRALAEPRWGAAEGREGEGGLGVVPSADEVGGLSPASSTRDKSAI